MEHTLNGFGLGLGTVEAAKSVHGVDASPGSPAMVGRLDRRTGDPGGYRPDLRGPPLACGARTRDTDCHRHRTDTLSSMHGSTDLTERFHALHRGGCFVMPNPWDVGSARLLAGLGFKALATTSSGFAWTLGKSDNRVTLHDALEHLRAVTRSVDIPVNADFEGGFAVEPDAVAANVARAAGTGVAGLSIEDSSGDPADPLFDLELSVARIRSARKAIDDHGGRVLLTARSEGFVVGRPDLAETIRRLLAYADAGADCLYAPRIGTLDEIEAVVRAVAPKPVNVLVGSDFTTVAALADLGVRRISVGGGLARVAWGAFLDAATEIAEYGTFTGLARGIPFAEIDGAFAREADPEP